MKACDISLDISIEMSLKNLRAKYGLDLVVMTKGCDGALLVSADDIVSQPGFKTDVVDTVGAGDSFTASMTLGLLEKKNTLKFYQMPVRLLPMSVHIVGPYHNRDCFTNYLYEMVRQVIPLYCIDLHLLGS